MKNRNARNATYRKLHRAVSLPSTSRRGYTLAPRGRQSGGPLGGARMAAEKVLALILGGGAGQRLYPLTRQRAKPAVPLGGKYRLIDIPVSNCINSDMLRILILTQYNSASLNRHIARTYRFSRFTNGFVEILAAEITPERPDWFQGTADAVRQSLHHLDDYKGDTILVLSGDH